MTKLRLRPVPGWLLGVAVGGVALAAAAVGGQLASHVEQRAVRQAGLTAQTVVATTVEENITVADLHGTKPLAAWVTSEMNEDVGVLYKRGLLHGLEVWRLDGTLLFADFRHACR